MAPVAALPRPPARETFGGTIHPSPSELTEAGRKILADDPDSPGSLGIAISEAVEVAAQHPDTNYALGSVLNHVLLHQTVIGEEALLHLAKVGDTPDVIVGCTGGGSNFAGLAFPFLREKPAGRMVPVVRAVEPASCPSLTKVILTALCGHGHLDLPAYGKFLSGEMADHELSGEAVAAAQSRLPAVPA